MAVSPGQVGVWVSPERLPLVREAVTACGLTVSHAGSPDAGQTRRVAADLHAAPEDDLRRLIVDPSGPTGPGLVLIADAAPDTALDARTIAMAAARGVRVATLEAIPGSAMAMAEGGWLEGGYAAGQGGRWFLGAMRTGRIARDAAEVLAHVQDASAVWVESVCGPHEGSMGARLLDALDQVRSLAGEAESVAASFTPAFAGSPAAPGETLTGLAGTMVVTLRLAGNRSAGVVVSDRASAWRRAVTVLSPKGRLTMTDFALEWRDPTGAVIDAVPPDEAPTWPAASVLTAALARFADTSAAAEGPGDLAAVMAMAQAALLSARTGQAESPGTIRRMVGLAEVGTAR
jgi:hypothetical protein